MNDTSSNLIIPTFEADWPIVGLEHIAALVTCLQRLTNPCLPDPGFRAVAT